MWFPETESILDTNRSVVKRTDETHNVLFPGNLEQAIHRARDAYVRRGADLPEVAAVLFSGLVQGHPFQAGNKRTGWLVLRAFLRENGSDLEVSADEGEQICKETARGEMTRDDIAQWIRDHLSNA